MHFIRRRFARKTVDLDGRSLDEKRKLCGEGCIWHDSLFRSASNKGNLWQPAESQNSSSGTRTPRTVKEAIDTMSWKLYEINKLSSQSFPRISRCLWMSPEFAPVLSLFL